MAETHVVFALIERRARLAGELRAKQAEVRQMKKALASIDLCIRMFKTDYDPECVAPKVTLDKNPAQLPKGSGSRKALDILRENRSAAYGTGTRTADPRAHGEGAERARNQHAREDDPQQFLSAEEPSRDL